MGKNKRLLIAGQMNEDVEDGQDDDPTSESV